jgi:DNA-binding transcriptional MerR regulator
MAASMPIGDFSRATHMSIKTLRHYHRVGLLEPADVDQFTGHRRYTTGQIPAAQVIRRFRELDMPIEEIRGVLAADSVGTRNELIAAHLSRLERGLIRTQGAVASLRSLLDEPREAARQQVSHRSVPATPAAAITASVSADDLGPWYQGALGELTATLDAQHLTASGVPGGIYSTELFADERGQATLFIPCARGLRPVGRVEELTVPAAELAVLLHRGPHDDIDRAYGTLAAHVTEREIAVDGPVREYYLAGRADGAERSAWQTEIGWPIFQTGR